MTALLHSRDGEGAVLLPAGRDPFAMAVHVYGGGGHTRVDTAELDRLGQALAEARRLLGHVQLFLLRARGDVRRDGHRAPAATPWAVLTLDEALDGPFGLRTLDAGVEELEGSLCQARILYEEAEEASRPGFGAPGEPSVLAFGLRLFVPSFFLAKALLAVGTTTGMLGAAPLSLLPGRSGLELALGVLPLPVSEPGQRTPHGIATQRAMREVAAEAQQYLPWFVLPEEITVAGTRFVPDEMSPGERTALPLALAMQALPPLVVGGRRGDYGVEVTPLLPPQRVTAPGGTGDLLRAMSGLMPAAGGVAGTVEVRRVVHRDGRRSWTVLVPGTQHQGGGGANPMDNLTNVEAYAGLPTDVEIGVAHAMEQAGIPPGEEVALVGHSQGGMTALRLAADPVFTARYDVGVVVTAGSPVGHMPTPPDVHVLSLEHLEDVVPGLDGTPNPAGPRRTTVSRSLTAGATGPHRTDVTFSSAHALETYARTADIADASGDASVRDFADRLAHVSGGQGAVVTATAFQVRRVAG